MAFSLTSKDITLTNDHILNATVRDEIGNWVQSPSLDLDSCIGNDNGK